MEVLIPLEIKSILFYKEKLMVINEFMFIIYIFNMIFMAFERRDIINEQKESPLIDVDGSLSKDLFENIIKRSLVPGNRDEILNSEYFKLIKENQVIGNPDVEFDKSDYNINNCNSIPNSNSNANT